jgi:isoquinoline 1-oxidoreductase subunit beta
MAEIPELAIIDPETWEAAQAHRPPAALASRQSTVSAPLKEWDEGPLAGLTRQRSQAIGPSHNVFVVESFMDELAAAAKQVPVSYRLALLDKSRRAKSVLALAAEKSGWGQPLPARVGRGVSLQFVFATHMAHVAEVDVSTTGDVRVRRVVCAVDCGTVVNPDIVRAQIESGIMFGITAALYGEITLKGGRVEQDNFGSYHCFP